MAAAADHTWQTRFIEAMRAELPFAPFHFDGWPAYEKARPLMGTGDPLQLVAAWPDHGWTVHYRPLLNEVIGTLQTPIDRQPQIVVFGAADNGQDWLEEIVHSHPRDPALVVEQLHQLGNRGTIPAPEQLGLGDVGPPGQADTHVRYIDASQPTVSKPQDLGAIYQLAGSLSLRLGPPVAVTKAGRYAFEPLTECGGANTDPLRITLDASSELHLGHFTRDPGSLHWLQRGSFRRADGTELVLGSLARSNP